MCHESRPSPNSLLCTTNVYKPWKRRNMVKCKERVILAYAPLTHLCGLRGPCKAVLRAAGCIPNLPPPPPPSGIATTYLCRGSSRTRHGAGYKLCYERLLEIPCSCCIDKSTRARSGVRFTFGYYIYTCCSPSVRRGCQPWPVWSGWEPLTNFYAVLLVRTHVAQHCVITKNSHFPF
jgi:hypothetical protein